MNLYEDEAIRFVNQTGFNHPEGAQFTITRVLHRVPVRVPPDAVPPFHYPNTFRNGELDSSRLPRDYETYLIINPLCEIVVTMNGDIAVFMFIRPRGSQEPFGHVSYENDVSFF